MMKNITKRPFVLAAAGLILVATALAVVSSDSFWLCVNTDYVIDQHVIHGRGDPLLAALRSSWLPKRVRRRAFIEMLDLSQDHRVYLEKREIESYVEEFNTPTNWLFWSADAFLRPWLDGKINPDVSAIVLGTNVADFRRTHAFQSLLDIQTFTDQQARDLEELWNRIDSDAIRATTLSVTCHLRDRGYVTPNVFKGKERPQRANKSLQATSQ